MMTYFRKKLRRVLRSESGAATVELVIVFPFFLGVFLSAFDVAMMNFRAVMLERATDIVVREIRLNTNAQPTYADVLQGVCAQAAAIPDCENTVKIELQPVDMSTWTGLQNNIDCVQRNSTIQPLIKFHNGQENELMLMRVCAVVDPFFPGIGVGRSMPKDASGGYQVIASSAFVNEPS